MIYVFGSSVERAENYAWALGLAGARCFSPASPQIYGVRFRDDDEVHLMRDAPVAFAAVVRRLVVMSRSAPKLVFPA